MTEGSGDVGPATLSRQDFSHAPAFAPVSAPSLTESRLITLSDGTEMYVNPGWNELPDGRQVYLRKDFSLSERSNNYRPPKVAKAMVTGNPAENQGPVWQPGAHVFDEGNQVAVHHGAWSARRVDPLAAELVETAVNTVSWLADPTYAPALFAWARAEARCQLVAEYLDKVGPLDEKGEPRGALNAADRLESLALKHRTRLGLDPVSRAQLEATLTGAKQGQVALEEAMARGAQTLEARRAASGLTQSSQGSPTHPGSETTRPQPLASPEDPTGARSTGENS